MPLFDVTCPTCGWSKEDCYETSSSRTLCPSGHATEHVWSEKAAPVMFGDDKYIGGVRLENLGHETVTVYSRSERKREMMARGLEEFVRHTPEAGTDKSRHTSNWASIGPTALEGARALLERVGAQKSGGRGVEADDADVRFYGSTEDFRKAMTEC